MSLLDDSEVRVSKDSVAKAGRAQWLPIMLAPMPTARKPLSARQRSLMDAIFLARVSAMAPMWPAAAPCFFSIMAALRWRPAMAEAKSLPRRRFSCKHRPTQCTGPPWRSQRMHCPSVHS